MTDLRKTQAIAELFLQGSPALAVTQVSVEVWVTMVDRATQVTQALAEVWATNTPTTYAIVTQAIVEVFMSSPIAAAPSTYRPYNVSSEVV